MPPDAATIVQNPAFFERVAGAASFVRRRIAGSPRVAIVLGSGLAPPRAQAEIHLSLPYRDVPGLLATTVTGHRGELISATWEGVPVLLFSGRSHYYEHGILENTLVQGALLAELGVETLLLTNAAGGIDPELETGDLMAIEDHLDFQFPGSPWPAHPAGFPRTLAHRIDYDPELLARIRAAARDAGIPLRVGVLMAGTGPSYETPAEVRMARFAGARAITMSTVPEARGARLWGLRVGGISTISNVHRLSGRPVELRHDEVLEQGRITSERLHRLLSALLRRWPRERAS